MAAKIVGATSPRTPSVVFFKLHPFGALAMMNGTLLVVWEVFGFPSVNFISSAFLLSVSMDSFAFFVALLPVVGSDEEHVVLLLAGLVNFTDRLIGCLDGHECSLVDTGVANHVWWGEVVHDEWELLLRNSL